MQHVNWVQVEVFLLNPDLWLKIPYRALKLLDEKQSQAVNPVLP